MVWLGSGISGFFIIVTDAWMQHPVAYRMLSDGRFEADQLQGSLTESVGMDPVCAQRMRRGGDRLFRGRGNGGAVFAGETER